LNLKSCCSESTRNAASESESVSLFPMELQPGADLDAGLWWRSPVRSMPASGRCCHEVLVQLQVKLIDQHRTSRGLVCQPECASDTVPPPAT
jgi:hypothetical protein